MTTQSPGLLAKKAIKLPRKWLVLDYVLRVTANATLFLRVGSFVGDNVTPSSAHS